MMEENQSMLRKKNRNKGNKASSILNFLLTELVLNRSHMNAINFENSKFTAQKSMISYQGRRELQGYIFRPKKTRYKHSKLALRGTIKMQHTLQLNVHRPEFLLRISGISTKTPIIVESEPVTRTKKLHNYVFDPKKSMSEQEKTRIGTVRHLPSHLQAEKNQAQALHARIGRNHQQASISR